MNPPILRIQRRDGFPFVVRLETADLALVPFAEEHISARYLAWLNDPEVNRYSRRRFMTTTEAEARRFLAALPPRDQILAMTLRSTGEHIGNLQLGPVDLGESRGEIRILIGEKSEWGKGYATQAIHAGCAYFFQALGLHRVEAMSANPGFIRAVRRLGWTEEGCMRERFPSDEGRLDYRVFGVLAREFPATAELIAE